MAEFVASGRKWNVQKMASLFTKDENGTHRDAFQVDKDANEIRLADFIDSDSFYAGMRASDAINEPSRSTPLYNDLLKDDASEIEGVD